MKKAGFLLVPALLVGYFAFWPVPIEPVPWQPGAMPGLEGVYAPNAYLAGVERLDLPGGAGPEDVAVDTLGRLYAGLQDGRIVRSAPDGSGFETIADTEGRPLGLDFDAEGRLYIADAARGLMVMATDGHLSVLSTEADGRPFKFADDVDIGADGTVYFSDASDRFSIEDYLLAIIENRPNGRLLAFDPASGVTRVLLDSLHFANGVAVSPDQAYVLVNETSRYRVRRYWIAGPDSGRSDVFLDNLPAFPDGVSSDPGGLFWVAMVAPRDPMVDWMAPHPWLRKLLLRLPSFLRPRAKHYAFVAAYSQDGRLVHNLQDPDAEQIYTISSVERYGDRLYLGSLEGTMVGRVDLP